MKKIKLFIATLTIATVITFPAMADWKKEANGRWWYQNEDGSYPVNQWKEIDGKQYYFGADGYMLANTITPDGKQVDSNGAMVDSGNSTNTTNEITIGMKNALSKANTYLEIMPFSYTGLIAQLEFEKYSHEEAVYAADNCGANWNENAVRKAKIYLELMAFSKEGLIEQLEFEGYTHEQAVYGVEQNGY